METEMASKIDALLPKLRAVVNQKEVQVDEQYIEANYLKANSVVSDKLLAYHCKERALEDLQQVIREKEMPLSEQLRLMRQLASKQFKLQWKIGRLNAYHRAQ